MARRPTLLVLFCLLLDDSVGLQPYLRAARPRIRQYGWVEVNGEWEWEEDDPNYEPPPPVVIPKLPANVYKPKQSLGQNYLQDANTVTKILKAFHQDNEHLLKSNIVELGPGAGALTDPLVQRYGTDRMRCIEIDERSVQLLREKHPSLEVVHQDVLQIDYPQMAEQLQQPLVVVGNLPYYITSQILFALADASHSGAVESATVTMQWEVGQRMVAKPSTKDYGILSVVFQLYSIPKLHFKIPPTVFYPKPKVDSALIGLEFVGPHVLRDRLCGVNPVDLRQVVTTSFQQRRKTLRNSLKKLVGEERRSIFTDPLPPLPDAVQEAIERGDEFALRQVLPGNWSTKRPEELTPGQFIEVTRLIFGDASESQLANKVWRKLKHGSN